MNALRRNQRGVALLVALLVVALSVILIAALLDRGELALARTRNVLRGEQAEAYALGLDTYAAQVLLATLDDQPDTNASKWATPLPGQAVPGGVIGASMRDLNGCFNLNNLAPAGRAAWEKAFDGLLTALALDQPELRTAVEHWLDPGQADMTDANFYLAQGVPYRPRGGLFAHVSELRLVRGVSGEVYARLAPHVCALPPGTKINVNTATVPVLMAVTGATQAIAQTLWQNGAARWQLQTDFTQKLTQLGQSTPAGLESRISTSSSYFLLRGDIVLDEVPFTFFSLIERRQPEGIRVLARSRGSDETLVGAAPIAANDEGAR
jgi:general secretion pathway protein K